MDEILKTAESTAKKIFECTYAGDYEEWFSYLCDDSVFECSGIPTLIGGDSIRAYFSDKKKEITPIIAFESHSVYFENGAQVYGTVTVQSEDNPLYASTRFLLSFKSAEGKLKLILQHMFYDYNALPENKYGKAIAPDVNAVDFVRNLLFKSRFERLPIESGTQILYINPSTVIAVDSDRSKTCLTCIDKTIQCNYSITKMREILPEYFYPMRRGNLINLLYLVKINHYEAELISDIKIPIPERGYARVKADLARIMPILDKYKE